MRTLVIYYSWSKMGNTQKLAEYMGEKLNATIEKLIDKKEKKGAVGWLQGGVKGARKMLTEIEPIKAKLEEYELICIGGPVWSWDLNPVVRTFLTNYKLGNKKIILFTTMGKNGDDNCFTSMKSLIGDKADILGQISVIAEDVIKGEYKGRVDEFLKNFKF